MHYNVIVLYIPAHTCTQESTRTFSSELHVATLLRNQKQVQACLPRNACDPLPLNRAFAQGIWRCLDTGSFLGPLFKVICLSWLKLLALALDSSHCQSLHHRCVGVCPYGPRSVSDQALQLQLLVSDFGQCGQHTACMLLSQ